MMPSNPYIKKKPHSQGAVLLLLSPVTRFSYRVLGSNHSPSLMRCLEIRFSDMSTLSGLSI